MMLDAARGRNHKLRIKRLRDGIDFAIYRRQECRRQHLRTPQPARVDSNSRHEPCHKTLTFAHTLEAAALDIRLASNSAG